MSNSRKLIVEVVGDASKLDKAFKGAERSATTFSGRIQSKYGKGGVLGGAVFGGVGKAGVIGAGVAAGSALALKGLSVVSAAAKDAQVAQAGLDQAFKASGVSQAKFGSAVDDTIQRVSKLAAVDDEDVSRSFANLLRTTGSVAKAERDVALAANIARARRISLAAATKVVEKAETGQLRGLKALGVQIDKNTTSSDAIDQAQKKFAGSAEAYGRTAAGAQDRYRVALENVEERIGAKLLPLQTKLALKAVDFLDWADRNWPRFAKAVGDAYRKAKPFIDSTIGIIRGIANEIAGVVRIVHGIFTGDWSEAWKGAKQVVVAGVGGIVKAIATLPLRIGAAVTQKAFAGMSKIGVWIKNAAISGLRGIGEGIVSAVQSAINRLIGLLNKAIGAYNRIPLAPNIPKIPTISGSAGASSRAVPIVRSERQLSGVGGDTYVTVEVDGRKIEGTVTKRQQQRTRRNPTKRRG